jgi:hypothetical protein
LRRQTAIETQFFPAIDLARARKVEKSKKGKRTGFLSLYARPPRQKYERHMRFHKRYVLRRMRIGRRFAQEAYLVGGGNKNTRSVRAFISAGG